MSLDGTSQKRGYSSLNGVVTLISSMVRKCLDFHVLSEKCRSCEVWSTGEGHPKYEEWKVKHSYQANHSKSSGLMEIVGAIEMLHRSKEEHKLRYTTYLGGGDPSSFQEALKSAPYGKDILNEEY